MIPVKISTSGTVTKADTYSEWYNYKSKQWANAIIPTSSAKSTVQGYSAGTTISESQIESYFVWIPKYKYKLFDMGTYSSATTKENKNNKAIEIVFGTTNTSDSYSTECATPKTSGESGKCAVGKYMTHPAFLAFGGKGLWVGKFETGYNGATSTSGAQKNTVDATKIIIKPNVYSWRYLTLSNAYKNALNYKTTLKSHLMKNTEWGAVAYLTQSIYGRCTSSTSCTEVTINNNSKLVTGFAGASVSQAGVAANPEVDATGTYNYKNSNSTKASTTGNYTGIYDMSGGAFERVMGVMTTASTASSASISNAKLGSSGFSSSDLSAYLNDSRYYDLYITGSSAQYNRRILGDATGELGPFKGYQSSYFDDYSYFLDSSHPWFQRCYKYSAGVEAGVFAFSYTGGQVEEHVGFRISLAV